MNETIHVGAISDPSDRATAEEQMRTADLVDAVLRRGRGPGPREDGLCACGCGNDVDPRRVALGYGLTLECAEARERRR
jgi:hypothetical protein